MDVSRFPYADAERRAGARAALGLPAEGRILCTSGQFIDRKDQGFLIDGVLSTPEAADCVFLLMGDGPNLKALRERFRDEPRIRFTGSVVNVQDYLAAADVYLSSAKSEGMPNGVLEAMAVGLPVLLSDIPQHLEVLEVERGYGLSYRIGDSADFRARLAELLAGDLRAMGEKASRVAQTELSAEVMSDRYQRLYSEIIEKKKKD